MYPRGQATQHFMLCQVTCSSAHFLPLILHIKLTLANSINSAIFKDRKLMTRSRTTIPLFYGINP